MGWHRSQHPLEAGALRGERVGVIDLEDASLFNAGYAVGTAVVAGTQDHHLLETVGERTNQEVVDQPGSGNA